MKTFLGVEVSYAPCKYKINSYIRVHLVVLVKMAPSGGQCNSGALADVFLQFNKSLSTLEIVILGERFVTRLTFSNVMP